ncbi:hypothetical protein [Aliamphritea hakodatensis]|uniref:hypothetical protein n=1 Tax=Aliamphritea hakodatensis TaxID=2895352 RepID=UPI0022FD7571|nr:hypothetical protein [Aliamphritea hakodatensis]
MHQYLSDTEYAVKNLIELASNEETELQAKQSELSTLQKKVSMLQWDYQTSDLNDDFSDLYALNAFNRMATADKEMKLVQKEVVSLTSSLESKESALQAISGGILQIAKQGISASHGQKHKAPRGRPIGDTCLRDVIWESRNQAMHYEEGRYKKGVKAVFLSLKNEFGDSFCLETNHGKSCAKQILKLLGWYDYEAYLADMNHFLQ